MKLLDMRLRTEPRLVAVEPALQPFSKLTFFWDADTADLGSHERHTMSSPEGFRNERTRKGTFTLECPKSVFVDRECKLVCRVLG